MKTTAFICVHSVSFFLVLLTPGLLHGQVRFSLGTDASLLHNFAARQAFTVIGQTLHGEWHTNDKNTLYAWFSYHSNGTYKNELRAAAKDASTQPQTIFFTNHSEMKLRQLSLGFKKYLLGSYRSLEKFNLYGAAGFGLMIGTASNNFSIPVDTAVYTVQQHIASGSGDFKRMTLDISAGWEIPLAYEIFLYSEVRMQIPTTDYPNNYLLKNNHAPLPGSINLGIRILFNSEQ